MLAYAAICGLTCLLGAGPAFAADVPATAQGDSGAEALSRVRQRAIEQFLGGGGGGRHLAEEIRKNDAWCEAEMARPLVRVRWDETAAAYMNQRLAACAAEARSLAVAYRSRGGRFEHNAEVRQRLIAKIENVLEHYSPASPRPGNWFQWHMTLPQHLTAAALLMQAELPPALLARLREALTFQLAEMTLTGPNGVWEARNNIYLALLENDTDRLARAAQHAFVTVRYATSGVQEDYSFLFHGRIPYAGGYGSGFCLSLAQLISMLDGSPWAALPAHRDLIVNTLLEHTRWFMVGNKFDLVVKGRGYERQGGVDQVLAASLLLARVGGARQAELAATAAALLECGVPVDLEVAGLADSLSAASGTKPAGFRYWPSSEMGAFKQPAFHVGFRQYSLRVQDYEYLTASGARGWNLAYGFTHILRSDETGSWYARETDRLHAEIDLEHLPGSTARVGGNPTNPPSTPGADTPGYSLNYGTSPFAGGAGWHHGGVAGFELRPAYSEFTAKKSLHFFPQGYWALGSGIRSLARSGPLRDMPLHTTVLQWVSSEATPTLHVNDQTVALAEGEERTLSPVRWLWLEGVAVVFAEPTIPVVRRRARAVTLWLGHGCEPVDASYAYAVLPVATLDEARRFSSELPVRPVRHDATVHAVRDAAGHRDGIVFFSAGSCLDVTADSAAIVYRDGDAKGGVVTIQDPLHATRTLGFTLPLGGEITCADPAIAVDGATGIGGVTIRTTMGRIHRFGYGESGRRAEPEPRADLSGYLGFSVAAENDAAKTLLTVRLPAEALRDGGQVALHGNRGNRLKVFTEADVHSRPAADTVRYLWLRQPAKTSSIFPHLSQTTGDFRVYLTTGRVEQVEYFTVPEFDASGQAVPDAVFRRDYDNPFRPRRVWRPDDAAILPSQE